MPGWVDTIDKREVPRQTQGRLSWQDLDELRTPHSALSEDLVAYAVEVDLAVDTTAMIWVRPYHPLPPGALDVGDHLHPRLTVIELFNNHYSLLVFDRHVGEFHHLDTANRNTNNLVADTAVRGFIGTGGVDARTPLTHVDWVPKQARGSSNCGPMVALMLDVLASTDGDPATVRREITRQVSNDAADRYRKTLLDNLEPLFVADDQDDPGGGGDEPIVRRGSEPLLPVVEPRNDEVDDEVDDPIVDEPVVDDSDDDEEEAEAVVARLPWEPRPIAYAMFLDPRPVLRVPASGPVREVPRSEFSREVRSTHAATRLALAAFYIEDAEHRRSSSCRYPEQVDHDEIGAHDRFVVQIDDPAPQSIRWEIVHAKHLQRGLLELFVADRAEPVWRRELSREQLRTAPSGEVSAGDTVSGGLAWTGSFAGGVPADDRVRAAGSPYKLKLTIFGKIGAVLATRQAWTYFDVPYRHKYKLYSYVPTTDFGCFGIQLDPERARFDVTIDALFGFLPILPREDAWTLEARNRVVASYPGRIREEWSEQYALRRGGVCVTPVILVRPLQMLNLPAMLGTQNPLYTQPDLLRRMNEEKLHFSAWFRDGIGGSGVMLHPQRASVNLFVPSAFEEVNGMMLSTPINEADLQRIGQRVIAELTDDPAFTGAGGRVEVLDAGRRGERPKLVLPFVRREEAVDPHTHGVALARVAAVLNAVQGELDNDMPVYVTGCMQPDERRKLLRKQHHDRRRAAGVATHLTDVCGLRAPGPTTPEATARERVAQRGYVVRTKEGQVRPASCVEIELGYTNDEEYAQYVGRATAYNALVHEFGHMLGIPDEYMGYEHFDATKSIAASQPRLAAMCRARGLAEPRFPGDGVNDYHGALMSAGVRFYERYYLTIAEALEKATSLALGAPTQWDIEAPGEVVGEANDDAFHTQFSDLDLDEAMHRARRRVEQHVPDPAVLDRKLRARILRADGAARIAYVRVVDRDTVAPVAHVDSRRVMIGVGVVVGDEVLHASILARQLPLHCSISLADEIRPGLHLLARGAARVPVTLRADHRFDGVGRFTCSDRRLRFYATADADAPIDMEGGHELRGRDLGRRRGVVLYMEGEFRGAKMALQLRSERHLLAPEVAAVELAEDAPGLDVYGPDDQPLSGADMAAPGAVVFLRREGLARPRTKLVVHRPQAYARRLVLRIGGPRVELYAQEQASEGEVRLGAGVGEGDALVTEYELPVEQFDAKGRLTLWLAGGAVSAAAGDAAIELRGIRRHSHLVDRARLTVIDATLTATVPATPARTERAVALRMVPAGANQLFVARSDGGERRRPNTADQVFDPALVGTAPPSALRSTSPYASANFERNAPLVLVRGALAAGTAVTVDLALAPAELAGAVTWDVVRASDDALDADPPTFAGAGLRCRVDADATGSFHVRALLDGRPLALLNLVLVEATLLPDGEDVSRAGVTIEPLEISAASLENQMARMSDPPQPQIIKVKSGDFADQPSVRLRGQVRLVGGGPDGRRGLDRVFAGWVQNLTHVCVRARYGGRRRVELVHVHNKDQASLLRPFQLGFEVGDSYFLAGDAPDELADDVSVAAPILDTGRMGQGGADSALGESEYRTQELRRRMSVTAHDAPATEFFVHYPGNPEAPLQRIRYEHDFRAYLCVWSNSAGSGDRIKTEFRAASHAGDRCVAVLRRVDWSLNGLWNAAWNEPPSPEDLQGEGWAAKLALAPDGDAGALRATITATDDTFRNAIDAGVELYYPTELHVFAWRCRQ